MLSGGRRCRQGAITLVSLPGQAGTPRLGLVVSRSCGTAVTRNRIKRRLRSAAREASLNEGFDYVIIGTRQVAETPYDRLVGWLNRAVEEVANA